MARVIGPDKVVVGNNIKFYLDPENKFWKSGTWSLVSGQAKGSGQTATIDVRGLTIGYQTITFTWVDENGAQQVTSKQFEISNSVLDDSFAYIFFSSYINNKDSKVSSYPTYKTNQPINSTSYQRYQMMLTDANWQTTGSSNSQVIYQFKSFGIQAFKLNYTLSTNVNSSSVFKNGEYLDYIVWESDTFDQEFDFDISTKENVVTLGEKIVCNPKMTTGDAKNCIIKYVWTVDGRRYATPELQYTTTKIGSLSIKLDVYIHNMETNQAKAFTKTMTFKVNKVTLWTPTIRFLSDKSTSEWGPTGLIHFDSIISNGQKLLSDVGPVAGSVTTYINDVVYSTNGSKVSFTSNNLLISDIGRHKIHFTGTAASVNAAGGVISEGAYAPVEFTSQPYIIDVTQKSTFNQYEITVNNVAVTPGNTIDLVGSAGAEIDVECSIKLTVPYTTTSVNKDLESLQTKGIFQFLTKDNVLVFSTDKSGKTKYKIPTGKDQIVGKVRWVLNDSSVVSPLILENPIQMSIYSNPITPTPSVVMTQTPSPTRKGSLVKISASVTKPTDSKITNVKWNGTLSANNNLDIDIIADNDQKTSFECLITQEGFDDYILSGSIDTSISANSWPAMKFTIETVTPFTIFEPLRSTGKLELSNPITDTLVSQNVLYSWYVDDKLRTTTNKPELVYTVPETLGKKSELYCIATLSDSTYQPQTIDVKSNVTPFECVRQPIEVSYVPNSPIVYVKKGEKVILSNRLSDYFANIAYEWTVSDENVNNNDYFYEFEGKEVGDFVVTMKSTLNDTNYVFSNGTNDEFHTFHVHVYDGVHPFDPDDTSVRYIHPLENRDAGFIYCGYWVLSEIQHAVKNGIDWKNPDSTDLLYKRDLRTIVRLLDDYKNAEIQESLNGNIIHRDKLETGEIYWNY